MAVKCRHSYVFGSLVELVASAGGRDKETVKKAVVEKTKVEWLFAFFPSSILFGRDHLASRTPKYGSCSLFMEDGNDLEAKQP